MVTQHLTAECVTQMTDVINVVKSITTPHDEAEDGWLIFFGLALLINCGLWVLLMTQNRRNKKILLRHGIDLDHEVI
jgi:hypothetical protein